MPEENAKILTEINEKLDGILRLMAEDRLEEFDTNKERIRFLEDLGIEDNQLIAGMLGSTPNAVSTAKSEMKKEDNNE